jgi:hypothetical protein
MRCKASRVIANPELVSMASGRLALSGTCSVCGCKVMVILSKANFPTPSDGGCNKCGKK